ncbi:MAG: hypothetical protein O2779_03170 [Nanoarchaeota archaeon]|nr:hypothetical protein [Nanoarchaeota archaeon]
MYKKGQGLPWQVIIIGIIALLVLVVVFVIFKNSSTNFSKELKTQEDTREDVAVELQKIFGEERETIEVPATSRSTLI